MLACGQQTASVPGRLTRDVLGALTICLISALQIAVAMQSNPKPHDTVPTKSVWFR